MQVLHLLVVRLGAVDHKHIRFMRHGEVGLSKSGYCQHHAVGVFATLDNVEGGRLIPVLGRRSVFQQIEDAVKADAGPVEGRKIRRLFS